MSIVYPAGGPRYISSNHFSVDAQAADAMDWLEEHDPDNYAAVVAVMPEWPRRVWGDFGTHFDTEAMGVDPEWGSWLIDAIEATGSVFWEEGEPVAYV